MKNHWVERIEDLEGKLSEAYNVLIENNYTFGKTGTFRTCKECGRHNYTLPYKLIHEDKCIIKKAEEWMEG